MSAVQPTCPKLTHGVNLTSFSEQLHRFTAGRLSEASTPGRQTRCTLILSKKNADIALKFVSDPSVLTGLLCVRRHRAAETPLRTPKHLQVLRGIGHDDASSCDVTPPSN